MPCHLASPPIQQHPLAVVTCCQPQLLISLLDSPSLPFNCTHLNAPDVIHTELEHNSGKLGFSGRGNATALS